METNEFDDSAYSEQVHLAERELSAFIRAVTELRGPEESKLAAEDWLDESELMDSAPRSEERDWRAVTVAASARLAMRLNGPKTDQTPRTSSPDAKAPRIPPSSAFRLALPA